VQCDLSDAQLTEALNVALVGGSIVIPHLRHTYDTIDALRQRQESGEPLTLD